MILFLCGFFSVLFLGMSAGVTATAACLGHDLTYVIALSLEVFFAASLVVTFHLIANKVRKETR